MRLLALFFLCDYRRCLLSFKKRHRICCPIFSTPDHSSSRISNAQWHVGVAIITWYEDIMRRGNYDKRSHIIQHQETPRPLAISMQPVAVSLSTHIWHQIHGYEYLLFHYSQLLLILNQLIYNLNDWFYSSSFVNERKIKERIICPHEQTQVVSLLALRVEARWGACLVITINQWGGGHHLVPSTYKT